MNFESKKVRIIKKYNQIIKTKLFLAILSFIFISIFILQISYFIDGSEINGIRINDEDSWKVWVVLTLSTVGSIFSFASTIATIRLKTSFFWLQVVSSVSLITSDIILYLWFDMTKLTILTILFYIRFRKWEKESENISGTEIKIQKIKSNLFIKYILIAIFIFVASGTTMYFFDAFKILPDPLPFLDAWNMVFLLFACVLLVKTYKESWLIFALSDFMVCITFGILGVWSISVMGLIYFFMDLLTYLSWTEEYKKNNSPKN